MHAILVVVVVVGKGRPHRTWRKLPLPVRGGNRSNRLGVVDDVVWPDAAGSALWADVELPEILCRLLRSSRV